MNLMQSSKTPLAVLISGGLDSAILLGNAVAREQRVHPLYIRCGLYWERIEERYLRRFVQALARPNLEPLTVFEMPVADVYGRHWSITGENVPDADSPDEAVFLPGRNVLLLAKALLWCHLHHVPNVALGSLQSNPFPDASRAFFSAMAATVNQAMSGSVEVHLPLAGMKKADVMHLGKDLPLEHTFSCIRPVAEHHCGQCNKCAERRRAFVDAGMRDPTVYADEV